MKKKIPTIITAVGAIYFSIAGFTKERWLIDFLNIPNTPTLDFILLVVLGLSGAYLIYEEVIK